ncbi:MAG: hypothetical protein ACLFO6_04350 [Archaeoglobaceae archaeon]
MGLADGGRSIKDFWVEGFEELINEVESLEDTIEILSDENLMEQIRNSEKDIKEGRVSDVKSADDLRRLFLE